MDSSEVQEERHKKKGYSSLSPLLSDIQSKQQYVYILYRLEVSYILEDRKKIYLGKKLA